MGKDYKNERNRDKKFKGKPFERVKKVDPFAKKHKGKKINAGQTFNEFYDEL